MNYNSLIYCVKEPAGRKAAVIMPNANVFYLADVYVKYLELKINKQMKSKYLMNAVFALTNLSLT